MLLFLIIFMLNKFCKKSQDVKVSCISIEEPRSFAFIPLLWILIVLVACSSGSVPTQLPGYLKLAPTVIVVAPRPSIFQPLPQDWQSRWLKGIPCRPPCWEGITPGTTNAGRAAVILGHSPLVGEVRQWIFKGSPEVGHLEWDWIDGNEGGSAYYYPQLSDDTINEISPVFKKEYELDDVMQAYGAPSYVRAVVYRSPDYEGVLGTRVPGGKIAELVNYQIEFMYLSQGFILSDDYSSIKPKLQSNMLLQGPTFFAPSKEGYTAAFPHPDWRFELYVPWQGIKDFDFYCRELYPDHKTCY